MSPLVTFGWGFAGSAAVEVVAILAFYRAPPSRLPRHYRRPGFWITRLALALLGGALAVGYEIDQAMLAFNIGAATPLIVTGVARGFRRPAIASHPHDRAQPVPREISPSAPSGSARRPSSR